MHAATDADFSLRLRAPHRARFRAPVASLDDPATATRRALRLWLGAGLLAVLLVPAARGASELIGWLPFWLVLAPLSSLLVAERGRIAAALSAFLVGGRRRRLRARRPQATPLRSARGTRRARSRAA